MPEQEPMTPSAGGQAADARLDFCKRAAEAMQRAAEVISSAADTRAMLERLARVMTDTTGIGRCTILLTEHENGQTVLLTVADAAPGERTEQTVPLDALNALHPDSTAARQPLVVEDVSTYPALTERQRECLAAQQVTAFLAVPLRVAGHSMGWVMLDEPGKRAHFSEEDVRLAEVVAAQVALVAERGKLLARPSTEAKTGGEDQHVRDMRALVEAGISLTAELSLDSVLQKIVDAARVILHARYAALGVLNEEHNGLSRFITSGVTAEERARMGHPPRGLGILGVIIREARPLRLRDLTQDPRSYGVPPNHPVMHSFLGVPIISRGRVFGNLYLTEKEGAEEFSAEDERMVQYLAAQAAVAIENAALFEEVKSQQERLVRAERLSAVGALASTVGHELRNPLSVINNAAFFLNAKVGRDDPRVARNLDILRKEVQSATHIIEDLLDFSRVRPPQQMPMDAAAIIQEAIERAQVPESVRVTVSLAPDLPRLWADPMQMQQVFNNLIRNAVEAMPDGGELRVEAAVQGDMVHLSISDTGVGIPPENAARIFEPLFTTKPKGVGLGLALVQRVVEAHGGQITLQSEVGKGTTFLLDLPIAKG